MQRDYPHEIIPEAQVPKESRYRFTPLTEEEHNDVLGMSPAQRHAWAREHLPTKERFARYLQSEGCPEWVVQNARSGRYDDFDDNGHELPQIEAVKDLRKVGRADIAKLVIDGEFDSTKAESDAWAQKQTGETARLLKAMDQNAQDDSGGYRY